MFVSVGRLGWEADLSFAEPDPFSLYAGKVLKLAKHQVCVCVAGDQPMLAEATPVILEQCSTFRFEWGGGGVIPQVPSAVYRLASPSPPAHLQQMITDRRY